jgi:dTMP kinase
LIRRVLLEVGDDKISPETELCLYLADRAQHVHEVIRPALAAGKIVLCDRFTDSTIAYQGYGRGADLKRLADLNRMASTGIAPELTFLLDCPAEMGLSRTARRMESQRPDERREDRFEREEAEFHDRVRRGFQEIARSEPDRVRVLDARRPVEDLHAEIRAIVEQRLAS